MSNNEIAGSSICSSEIKTLQRSRSRSRVDYHEKDWNFQSTLREKTLNAVYVSTGERGLDF